jgi:flagellar assembly factor FliW
MAVCQTQHLGLVEYDETSVIEFTEGIPAFPDALRFILIEPPAVTPLIYLQCLSQPDLCFLTVPALCLDPFYRLLVPEEEFHELGPSTAGDGSDHLVLAILTVSEETPPTANLMAPVVIHRGARRGRQLLQTEGGYSFTQPLGSTEGLC